MAGFIQVIGAKETAARLAGAGAKVELAVTQVRIYLSDQIVIQAKANHPWNNVTGATEDSIQTNDRGAVASSAAYFLEFGTSKMAARPFMFPATDVVVASSEQPVQQIVATTLAFT